MLNDYDEKQVNDMVNDIIDEKCKGKIYRLTESAFENNNKQFIFKRVFTFLEDESCPGCELCNDLNSIVDEKENKINVDKYENGGKYKVKPGITAQDVGVLSLLGHIF